MLLDGELTQNKSRRNKDLSSKLVELFISFRKSTSELTYVCAQLAGAAVI
jgi:hypothetical protein